MFVDLLGNVFGYFLLWFVVFGVIFLGFLLVGVCN